MADLSRVEDPVPFTAISCVSPVLKPSYALGRKTSSETGGDERQERRRHSRSRPSGSGQEERIETRCSESVWFILRMGLREDVSVQNCTGHLN